MCASQGPIVVAKAADASPTGCHVTLLTIGQPTLREVVRCRDVGSEITVAGFTGGIGR